MDNVSIWPNCIASLQEQRTKLQYSPRRPEASQSLGLTVDTTLDTVSCHVGQSQLAQIERKISLEVYI